MLHRKRGGRRLVLALWLLAAGGLAALGFLGWFGQSTGAGVTSVLARQAPEDAPPVVFREDTAAGVSFTHFNGRRSSQLPEDMGSGLSWCDYDGDGDLDLFAVNIAGPLAGPSDTLARSPAHCALFANDGHGKFTDVTTTAHLDWRGIGMGCAWADYDRDGHSDLVVSAYGGLHLFHQDPDRTFRDVTKQSGMANEFGFWTGVAWGDYDRDGWLDLYVCGYVKYAETPADPNATQYGRSDVPATLNPSAYAPERNLLFHNERDGTFREVGVRAGVDDPTGRSLSAVWADFDEDGWLDLYVANDVSDNALFRNRGDGTFEDIALAAGVADYRGAMGLAVGDPDRDGDLDLVVTHWLGQENAYYRNWLRESGGGPLRFRDVADEVGLGQIALPDVGWGVAFLDIDLDGWEDPFIVNGSTLPTPEDPYRLDPQRPRLFWNRGPVTGFVPLERSAGELLAIREVARGLAVADYDNDGDEDLAVLVHSGPLRLWRNDQTTGRNWIALDLRGETSPAAGEGSVVTVVASGARQTLLVGGDASYLSGPATRLLVGLDRARTVDSLLVRWTSGRRTVLTGLPANRRIVITEPTMQNVP